MEELRGRVVKELEDLRVWYFTDALTTNAKPRQLEVPQKFTRRTGWPNSSQCSLMTSITTMKEWPVRFELVGDPYCTRTWVSVGAGYSDFLADNGVDLPALLVFEKVDNTTLAVTIHRDNAPPALEPLPPPPYEDDRPHFQKTLKACHVRPLKSSRLDVPTAYWRTVGDDKFDGAWYTFVGPVETVLVKSARCFSRVQTFCYFNKGWVDFVALNHLRQGDTLVFAATGEAEFEVVKL